MEFLEDHFLYDEEGTDLQEEADHGHEFDDEEGEAPQENMGSMARGSLGIQEYEFSCSNSPNPVFFHLPKRKHHYFPCINPPEDIEEPQDDKAVVLLPKTPEYTVNFPFDTSDLAPADKPSPLPSPFSVRVSNYSSEEEMDVGGNRQVDDEAEEFIRRFYEQLRAQSRIQLLQSQEMIAGGTP
uniref:Uncharacterized protein n=1 Tax=Vitis vinifera TaxID=29760 RepID=A5BL78_VITVI|nr:hypothetical protein VITISV_044235 [Vitis vinifera]